MTYQVKTCWTPFLFHPGDMQQLSFNLEMENVVCSFRDDAYDVAKKIIAFRGKDALIYVALRQFDDFQDKHDRAFWIEVRRACKYILTGYDFWYEGHHRRLPLM
ncbi:hypothetical protein MICA_2172 [Micavibrio aeruginosavorus ARL-13]|uniref:Uncharacterized protein n=2 Tax=Micavibrio aeruginosavorus TaxID=349221 RepID=G2KR00_MICAA|nr:hypothetical protein MICA_2172 [Micavibrio aeruginosavorus ARL-13]